MLCSTNKFERLLFILLILNFLFISRSLLKSGFLLNVIFLVKQAFKLSEIMNPEYAKTMDENYTSHYSGT